MPDGAGLDLCPLQELCRTRTAPTHTVHSTQTAATSMAIFGAAGGWATRTRMGQDLQSGRQADRLHCAARAVGQCLLRRAEAQPPVHGGKPFGLFALCEHAGCARWVSPAVCRDVRFGPKADIPVFIRSRHWRAAAKAMAPIDQPPWRSSY